MNRETYEALEKEALSWVGTPFVWGQCVKGAGVDCGWFVIAVYRSCGIGTDVEHPRLPRGWFYNASEDVYLILAQSAGFRIVDDGSLEPGDFLTFAGRSWPSAGHCGIYLDGGFVIHAVANRGVEVWPFPGSDLLRRTHRHTLRYG